jgi:alpha-tubulin suppressor-like RCC1 family protein
MTGVADIYGDVQGSIVNGFIATAPVVKKTDGTLWSWGYNVNGETGCGTGNNNELVPKQIKLSAGIGIGLKAVSTCFSSSVAGSTRFLVTADNQLYVWGNSSTYLLDPVTAGDIFSPLLLNPPILTI